jgi:tetratricopeptide (TPR) repeat protein
MKYLNRFALLLAFASLVVETQASSTDSLVRWNEISFISPFERSSFKSFLKDNDKDYLRLFLTNSMTAEDDLQKFEAKIKETLTVINSSDALKKKNDKKVKYIYQLIHDRFLSKYEAENLFYEIIKTGNYNCVTATALYAMFFEKLGIPYAIKEEPTHVYLVAYPNAENILIETTTPASGFLSFDATFKSNYVNTLKSQKIIGGIEVQSSNVDALFNKYYFGKEDITLTQLIGIHYINDGLFKRDHDDITGAYEQIKKGYLYYPNTRSEFLLMSFTAASLEEINLEPVKKATLIGRLSRFQKTGVTSEMIQGEFHNLTQTILLKNNDKELYKKAHRELVHNVIDPELSKEINYIFYYENGRVFYNQGNYIRAKPFFAKALEIQPNNVDLGGTFVSCLAQSFRNERNNTAIVDSLEIYKVRFPSLTENNNFNAMMSMAYVTEFGNSFEKGNSIKGEKYQKLFEEIYAFDKSILSPESVGRAYSEASVYFFKKGQKAKANQLLEKGLEIVPNDFQLKRRKQMMNGG